MYDSILYEVSRIGKSIETDTEWWLPGADSGKGEMGVTA